MSEITRQIGERLRALRLAAGLTQERLAERAELHPTYIGQLERGEKNVTIESLLKITRALGLPPDQFFSHLPGGVSPAQPGPADTAYQLLLECPPKEQQALLELLRQIISYKKI